MKYLFLQYPKCSTCQKSKKWLEEHHIDYISRHIIEQNPTEDELIKWIEISKLPLKSFFNTSGIIYRELNLKEKIPTMSQAEQIKLLASNGKLVKRPMLINEDVVLVGFSEGKWRTLLDDYE